MDEDDTRKAILDTAYELFSLTPYQGLPMEAIAREAGVSKALLFYHFGSKRELARRALIHGFDREMVQLHMLDGVDEDMLRPVLSEMLQLSLDRFHIIQTFVEVADVDDPGDELTRMLRGVYRTLRDSLEPLLTARGVRNPGETTMLLALAIDTFGLIEHIEGEPPDVDRYVDAILGMMSMEADR